MTREQSREIREVELIIDYLDDKTNVMMLPQSKQDFGPITHYVKGSALWNEEWRKDVEIFNSKVHDYAHEMLTALKGKYLKIYADL